MFKIAFIDSSAPRSPSEMGGREMIIDNPGLDSTLVQPGESASLVCDGQLILGRYTERFESPLHYWWQHDYEEQWHAAISRLLAGSRKTALITAMYDPAIANFLTWWPLYQEGQTICVQNQLLFLDTLTTVFDVAGIDEIVQPHRTVNDEGSRISEWSVPVTDVKDFARNLNARGQ